MSIEGYYYLHENGSLIFKRDLDAVGDFRDSDLVKMFWPFDSQDRRTVWRILVEASAHGAKPERIRELSELWQCDDDDAHIYARELGVELCMDGDMWHAMGPGYINIQESNNGFGKTCLEAMAELAKDCGLKPQKTWGHTFKSILELHDPANGQFGVGA